MRQFKFQKPIVESPYPPQSTNVLWVDIDEATGKIVYIKEFDQYRWKSILFQDHVVLPPDNQIWYTTHNRNIVNVCSYKQWPLILEHDYDANKNRGVIVFEDDFESTWDYLQSPYLGTVYLPNSTKSIDDCAFINCYTLNNVYMGNNVSTIGRQAFRYCTGLQFITLPASVKTIYEDAFQDSGLTEITCLATTPPQIESKIFFNTPLKAIYVPSQSIEAYKTATNWAAYAGIIKPL